MKELVKPIKLGKKVQSTELYDECTGGNYCGYTNSKTYCNKNYCGSVNTSSNEDDIIF